MTSRTSRSWSAAAGLLTAFLLLTLWVRFHGPLLGEARLWRAVHAHPATSQDVSSAYQFFSGLGSPFIALLVTVISAAVLWRSVGAVAALLLVAGAAISLLEPPLADLVGGTDAAAQLGNPAGGYPSGHVLFATGCFGVMAWLGVRRGRRELAAVAVLLIVLMGMSRLADRSHSLSEVLGAYLLGGAWVAALMALATRFTTAS